MTFDPEQLDRSTADLAEMLRGLRALEAPADLAEERFRGVAR
ncbi:hypothetical protein [Kitasatospora sp. NPDC092286]